MKWLNKKIISIIVLIVLFALGIYQVFLKKEKPAFTLAEVIRGDVIQEVSESGQVKKGEEINLSFKSSGEIEEIYVKVGDKVEAGESLAKLDTKQLEIQLTEAQAALSVIEAQKRDAQISLENERQKLEDTIAIANEKIEKAYKDAQSALDDSYLKIYNSFNFIDYLKRTYFNKGDTESITISEIKVEIEKALNLAKFYTEEAKSSSNKEDIDLALSKNEEALLKTKEKLEEARNITEGTYRDIVSKTDKDTLDTHRLNIITSHSNVVSAQQNISLIKVQNQAEINTTQSEVANLENQLQESEAGLYQAQINQAQAKIRLLENQIKEATIISPVQGQITKIQKRIGEIVQPMLQDVVISLLPIIPFEIEVNIYEEDIVKINVGNQVDISLVAFPEKIFKGKVITIDPAEKAIEGVIYYEVKILFEGEIPQDLKPGMTVDVKIKTASKENVLVIPEGAIQKKNGKKFIEVLERKKNEEREVVIGLEGSNGMAEIISGVSEGERIIVR